MRCKIDKEQIGHVVAVAVAGAVDVDVAVPYMGHIVDVFTSHLFFPQTSPILNILRSLSMKQHTQHLIPDLLLLPLSRNAPVTRKEQ